MDSGSGLAFYLSKSGYISIRVYIDCLFSLYLAWPCLAFDSLHYVLYSLLLEPCHICPMLQEKYHLIPVHYESKNSRCRFFRLYLWWIVTHNSGKLPWNPRSAYLNSKAQRIVEYQTRVFGHFDRSRFCCFEQSRANQHNNIASFYERLIMSLIIKTLCTR